MGGLLGLPTFSQTVYEPEALGLPGDNLNLYAVLDVFQKSKTLEAFERAINDEKNNINNLDLNNDRLVDYIEVVSYDRGRSHSIVLRVAINNIEYQDVAVIEVNENSSGKVTVQIIGDEELYGKYYIVEPSRANFFPETPNPGYMGNQTIIVEDYYSNFNNIIYVNDWPIIIHLFSPTFSFYISSWHWGFYPSYWHPWTPVYFYYYWGYHNHYFRNNFYRRAAYIRYPSHYSYYVNRRSSSTTVRQYRTSGAYNYIYEGRIYKKPLTTQKRTITTPVRRQTIPSTRQVTPSVRQTIPSTRQVAPSSGRQTTPTTRQTTPTTRQTNPSARPTNRPSNTSSRPSR